MAVLLPINPILRTEDVLLVGETDNELFRAETVEGKHYLSVYNSAIPWLMKEYDTIEEAETKLAGIINVVKTGSHIDLDTLLAD